MVMLAKDLLGNISKKKMEDGIHRLQGKRKYYPGQLSLNSRAEIEECRYEQLMPYEANSAEACKHHTRCGSFRVILVIL